MIGYRSITRAIFAAAFAVLAFSCVSDTESAIPPEGAPGAEETVLLSIDVPGAMSGASRALLDDGTVDAECNIEAVDVLLFGADGKFAYRAVGYDISGSGTTRSFQARLLTGSYSLVVVANARKAVNDAMNGTGGATQWIVGTTARQDALDRLNMTVAATAKLTTGGVMTALPMFGYVASVNVQKGLSLTGANAVAMVRSVAKIEVQLTTKAASGTDGGTGNANFRLYDAHLYNQPLTGWVVPAVASWDTSTNEASAPYYGGNASPAKAVYPANAPVRYAGAGDNVTDNNILRSIYLFEAPAGSAAGRNTNTCIVVGGYYKGSSTPSYYRADLRELAGDVATYLPVMRNHCYTVNVKSVTGSGYPTPDDAFYGEASLMEIEVVPWNEAAQNVIFDGQYFLKVNRSEYVFRYPGGAIDIEASTDYDITSQGFPAGLQFSDAEIVYTPTVTAANRWLTLSGSTGALSGNVNITATANTGTALRSAKVYLKAGNFTKVIDVVQLPNVANYGALINSAQTYSGAFWRADQRGERLIRIPVAATTEVGKWAVYVYDYGDDFTEGDILFSTAKTTDAGCPWSANYSGTNIHSDPDYGAVKRYVTGGRTSVSGTVALGDCVEFRIGLKQTFTPTADKPARYATIIISYNDNKKVQKLFLRQGEGADFLMRPEEPAGDGSLPADGNGVYRPLAVKISPYNLTHPDLKNGTSTGGANIGDHPQVPLRSTIDPAAAGDYFTDYPTQIGAFFQWAVSPAMTAVNGKDYTFYERRAFHPTNPGTGTAITDWSRGTTFYYTYWSSLRTRNEACPPGWRRFHGGDLTTDVSNIAGADSDIMQSLFPDPSGNTSTNPMRMQGCYADGYFDRFPIVDDPTDWPNSIPAARGYLLLNLNRNASLFHVLGGERNYTSGTLSGSGTSGTFYAGAQKLSGNGIYMLVSTSTFRSHSTGSVGNAFVQRCVRE